MKDDFLFTFRIFPKPGHVQHSGFVLPGSELRKAILESIFHQISVYGDRLFGDSANGAMGGAAGFYKALFLGVTDDLDFSLREEFRKTGSMHLLALSGLHVGMIIALVMLFFFWMKNKRLKTVIAVAAAIVYMFLAGPRPSLLRAVLMCCGATIGLLIDRERRLSNILAFSLCAVLVFDPAGVYTLSFALSYAAVFGIITFGTKLHGILSTRIPSGISALLSMSLAAQLFTAPFVFQTFGVVYPSGLVASVVLVPLVTVFFWAGTLCLPFTLVPLDFVGSILSFIMNFLYEMISIVARMFTVVPGVFLEWQNWYWIPAGIIGMIAATNITETIQNELRKHKRNTGTL